MDVRKMVGERADHHVDFWIQRVKHVRVHIQKIFADTFLIQYERVLQVLEACLGVAVRNVEQCKEIAEVLVEFGVWKVGVILLQNLDGDVLAMHHIAEFREPGAELKGRFKLFLGGEAQVVEGLLFPVRAQTVKHPFQLLQPQLL